ncbi:hypothetical protein ASPZODRAFT_141281 [Penicilliopsis zonata CBS 506.65]|uniref:Uncharacterized protein n=1 Tax=Penicilliopsis zonata CBS 506.65 TaxID=1073090 RepID=A0A1L9SKH0_9EURO|nr:hypothetical protein ASPZODRAFT_141281 [Penicilliopsis zonata CBS 506.65]OJJ47710.1 hypothetical protein ASPZODRAFT_141281 [Penicilliopsis zonata CBS 506.65]
MLPSVSLSAFFVVPFLTLISIPLILSAYVTVCFSFLALFLRVSIVYLELCFALATNYFVIATSPTSSFLTFTASEPASPTSTTSRSRPAADHLSALPRSPSSPTRGRSLPALKRSYSAVATDGSQGATGRSHRKNLGRNGMRFASSTTLHGLVSGDERRDFEGLGGWRIPATSTHRGLTPSSSVSSLSAGGDDEDETAWLSINNRLELPLRRQSLGTSAPVLGRPSSSPPPPVTAASPHRHHRRSVTTSMINNARPQADGAGLSFDRLRPERTSLHASSDMYSPNMVFTNSPFQTVERQMPHFQPGGGESYFALPRPNADISGTTTPQTTYQIEDGRNSSPSSNIGRPLVYYPPSPRNRRSLSRSHSGTADRW